MDTEKKIPIETAFEQLESLITKLESRDCTLEESFRLYKEGVGLIQYCDQALSEVEQQLIVINGEDNTDEF